MLRSLAQPSSTVLSALAPTTARLTVPVMIHPASISGTVLSASGSTVPPDVPQLPASSCMFVVTAILPTTQSLTVHAASPESTATTHLMDPVLATTARDKVHLQARNRTPCVSTPINIDCLAKELSDHPNHNFVDNLIQDLLFGIRASYSGPENTLGIQQSYFGKPTP